MRHGQRSRGTHPCRTDLDILKKQSGQHKRQKRHRTFCPRPQPHKLGPECKEGTRINVFRRDVGVEKGVPNEPFWVTSSYCSFLPLQQHLEWVKSMSEIDTESWCGWAKNLHSEQQFLRNWVGQTWIEKNQRGKLWNWGRIVRHISNQGSVGESASKVVCSERERANMNMSRASVSFAPLQLKERWSRINLKNIAVNLPTNNITFLEVDRNCVSTLHAENIVMEMASSPHSTWRAH